MPETCADCERDAVGGFRDGGSGENVKLCGEHLQQRIDDWAAA